MSEHDDSAPTREPQKPSPEDAAAQAVQVVGDGADATGDGPDGLAEIAVAPVDPERVRALVEALLFLADAPVEAITLASGLGLPVEAVATAIDELSSGYRERGAGFEVQRIAGGVRLSTRDDLAEDIERYLREGQRSRLTQAALETVAVIAYRQPITRARISAIRGVSVDGVIRTLLSRGLISEVGADPETAGTLYGTTDLFLEKMGLQSLEELPSLAPLLPEIDSLQLESP
jgi:segregation and condensation protein B